MDGRGLIPIPQRLGVRQDASMTMTPEPPESPTTRNRLMARGRDFFRHSARTLGLILLTFVAWVWVRAMADPYGYLSVDPAVLFAMGLVGAGVLLLRGQQPVYEEAGATVVVPKQKSPLGVLTLSAAFLTVGVLILLGNLGAADVTIGHLPAATLTVVGLGLLVGTWWGRSRSLIVIGVVLVPFVLAGGFMHLPLRGSVGDRWVQGRDIDNLELQQEVLVGTVHMNLADLRDFTGEREIDITIAAGNATIFVPKRVGLTITGDIEWGNATIGRGREQGADLVLANEIEGRPDAGHLTIDFTGGIASLYVERISYRDLHGPLPGQRRKPEEPRRQERDRNERDKQAGRRTREKT